MFDFNNFRTNRISALSSMNSDITDFIAALTEWASRAAALWGVHELKPNDEEYDEEQLDEQMSLLIDELDNLGIGEFILSEDKPSASFTEIIGRVFLVIDNLKKKRKEVDRSISSFEEDFAKMMDSLTK